MASELIRIEGSRFIFSTNFEGDPAKDKYRSPARKGNIVLSEEQAKDLRARGFNVKETKPRPDEEDGFVPTYFVPIIVRFGEKEALHPKIYLVTGENNQPVRLTDKTIGLLDDIWVENVDCMCGAHEYEPGKFTLYVRVMYVTQKTEEDPYASKYSTNIPIEEDVPF